MNTGDKIRDLTLSLLLAGSLITLASIDVDAEETVESHGSSRGANIGFMPNPPKELTKNFSLVTFLLAEQEKVTGVRT